jgi:hypothetical protein
MAFNVAATVTLRSHRNASLFWIMLWLIFGQADHGVISACRLQVPELDLVGGAYQTRRLTRPCELRLDIGHTALRHDQLSAPIHF